MSRHWTHGDPEPASVGLRALVFGAVFGFVAGSGAATVIAWLVNR